MVVCSKNRSLWFKSTPELEEYKMQMFAKIYYLVVFGPIHRNSHIETKYLLYLKNLNQAL